MDCPAKTLKIHKKRYFLWLSVIGIMTGGICFYLRINSNTAMAVPLNGRFPSPDQFMPRVPPPEAPETLPGDISLIPNIEQEVLDLLRNSSLTFERPIVQNPPSRTMKTPQWKTVRMLVTGYCACPKCCGKFSDGYTANMHRIKQGDVFVAADKKVPFGTRVMIPGYNRGRSVEVKDRGRLIRGNHLDLYFTSHKTAQKWGAKYLDVRVKVEE